MAAKYWLKLYHEILDDPKMGMLPDSIWRRVIEMFLLAGEYDQGGLLPPLNRMAWRLRITPAELEDELTQMAAVGIVSNTDNGWLVVNFNKRQAAVTGAERVAQHRKRNKPVTPDNIPGNESVTNRYTDIDTDKDNIYTDSGNVRVTNGYTHPDPEPIAEIKTALSKVSKTPFWVETESTYDQAAYMIYGWDCTAVDIEAFGKWWAIPGNGHYKGKPVLKSLLQEFPNFLAARHPHSNGKHIEPDPALEELLKQMEVAQ